MDMIETEHVIAKDYFGSELEVGSKVIFMEINYRSFVRGIIVSLSKQTALIEYRKK